MATPDYRFVVVDLRSGLALGELPFTSASWSTKLNRVGSFSGSIPMRHPALGGNILYPSRRMLVVERNGLILWAGIMGTEKKSGSVEAPVLEIGAESLWGYFHRRVIDRDMHFGTAHNEGRLTPATKMAALILAYSGFRIGANLMGVSLATGSDWGPGRQRSYLGSEVKSMGSAIEDLTEVGEGFDFEVEVYWDEEPATTVVAPAGATTLRSRIKLWYPGITRTLDQGLVLGQNIKDYSWERDGQSVANRIIGKGAGSGDTTLTTSPRDYVDVWRNWLPETWTVGPNWPVDDAGAPSWPPAAQAAAIGYPEYDMTFSDSDISVFTTLQQKAYAILDAYKNPVQRVTGVTVTNPGDWVGNVRPGDSLPLTVEDGPISLVGEMARVTEVSCSVDSDGSENLSMTLQAAQS